MRCTASAYQVKARAVPKRPRKAIALQPRQLVSASENSDPCHSAAEVSINQPVRLAPKVIASGDSERVPRRPRKV
ncbi:MAG: hypothetical protein CRU78_13090 [Candidatus Accumulibacter phosphatis]|uniref:Uncharacterized protein n=1 Tax=Candidatus Accumulibacter phosphatis TaxID=327160 RepID=A0A6A7RV38_9PROT|nr:hypothetical protein [Candidatus Accumulibacter phosphatis]